MNTIVVSIDGGSRGNNIKSNPNSTAAFGVFFGRNCPRNFCRKLDRDLPQTSNRAELEALFQALVALKEMYDHGDFRDRYREVIIMTDSEYVAKSMDKWIWNWLKHDGRTVGGKPVKHWELVEELHDRICAFEQDCNMSVRFWRVDREWNAEADALVNQALEGNCQGQLATDWVLM